jgi:hypothetical protein
VAWGESFSSPKPLALALDEPAILCHRHKTVGSPGVAQAQAAANDPNHHFYIDNGGFKGNELSFNAFFLTMAHCQLGQNAEARQ